MNMYITDKSLNHSAMHLDNARLSLQFTYLCQVVNMVLHKDIALYEEYLQQAKLNYDRHDSSPYTKWMLPVINKDKMHNLVAWVGASPLHLCFAMAFLRALRDQLGSRSQYVNQKHINFYDMSNYVQNKLHGVVPTRELDTLYGFEKDLYRGLPDAESNEPDTIKAYREYLIKHWKGDLLREKRWEKSYLDYKTNEGPKPRLVKRLRWGRFGIYSAPSFAINELKEYKKGLDNAEIPTT